MSKTIRALLNECAEHFIGTEYHKLSDDLLKLLANRVTDEVLKGATEKQRQLRLGSNQSHFFALRSLQEWRSKDPGDKTVDTFCQSLGYFDIEAYEKGIQNYDPYKVFGHQPEPDAEKPRGHTNPNNNTVYQAITNKYYWTSGVLIGITIFWVWTLNDTASLNQQVEQYLKNPYQNPMLMRGSNDYTWIKYYNEGDFTSSAITLQNVSNRSDIQNFFLGLSLLYQGHYEETIPVLETLEYHELLGPQSLWFLALAYFQTGEIEQTKNLLLQLVEQSEFKKNEATAILDEL